MTVQIDAETREAVVAHVLRAVHPDHLEAEVSGVAPEGDRAVVGVKVSPRGYLASAKYALVTVDSAGEIVASEACTGGEMKARIEKDGE